MSPRERRRLAEFSRVKDKLQSVAEAGRRLGLSERQAFRLWRRYVVGGDGGLVHGLRGRASNASKGSLRERALALYRSNYGGCNASHARDLLADEQKITVDRRTMWRWLKAENLVSKGRRVEEHRIRRVPCAYVGQMSQMDGSTHRWLGEAFGMLVLFVMVDDATGRAFARFYLSENTASAFDVFGRYVRANGVPRALYVDRDSIYVVNDAVAKLEHSQSGKPMPLTQFGRAMEELGVSVICANSPEAKGRVERKHGVLQDRLVKELALSKVSDLASANVFLEKYLKGHNERFGRVPAQGANQHGRVRRGLKLEDVLCVRENRVVGRDWCVAYGGRTLQIGAVHRGLSLAGRVIQVLQPAEGPLKLRYQGRFLEWSPASTTAPGRGSSCPLLAPLDGESTVANASVPPPPVPALGGGAREGSRPGPRGSAGKSGVNRQRSLRPLAEHVWTPALQAGGTKSVAHA